MDDCKREKQVTLDYDAVPYPHDGSVDTLHALASCEYYKPRRWWLDPEGKLSLPVGVDEVDWEGSSRHINLSMTAFLYCYDVRHYQYWENRRRN
jgi:hypothetical protein